MTVDRGGLQYPIKVDDAFSAPLDAFVTKVRAAADEVKGLAAAAASLKKSSEDITKATKEADKATKATKKSFDVRGAALRKIRDETRAAAVAQQKADIEVRNGATNAKRLATAEQQRIQAEKDLTKTIGARGRAEREAEAAQRRGVQLTEEERQKKKLLSAQEEQLLRIKKQVAALQATLSGKEILQRRAEAQALREKIKLEQQAALAAERAKLGLPPAATPGGAAPRATSRVPAIEKETAATEKQQKSLLRLRDAFAKSGDTANRVSFTFRRLFGILAAFAAARAVVRGFRNLISELIRFNASIEQATLGVASLFLAVGDVRDATGEAVTASQGLALAQAEARRQVALLRRDALKTAATFEQLLETFQVAVAPGLQSGLDIEQIRKFTLDISRAAAAIGLQQNQLAEEIRSILSGTIQARTTRVAVALGITNEDIRNAKELGILFDFLQEKFSAFDAAGEEALKTFNALWTNLYGAIQQVLESGGLDFFNAVKDTLRELFDLLINQDPITEVLTPDPTAVTVVRAFTNALRDALLTTKEIAGSLDTETFVQAAKAAGDAIKVLASVIANIIKGALRGFADLGRIAQGIRSAFNSIGGDTFDVTKLNAFIESMARLFTVSLGISAVLGVIKLTTSAIALTWGLLVPVLSVVQAILVTIAAVVGIIEAETLPLQAIFITIAAVLAAGAAAVALMLYHTRKWLSAMTGVNIKFTTLVKILKVTIPGLLAKLGITVAQTFIGVVFTIRKGVLTATAFLVDKVFDAVTAILDIFDAQIFGITGVRDAAFAARTSIENLRTSTSKALQEELDQRTIEFNNATKAFEAARDKVDETMKNGFAQALKENETAKSLKDLATDAVNTVIDGFSNAFSKVFESLNIPEFTLPAELTAAVEQGKTLTETFDVLTGTIAAQRDGLKGNVELVKELKDEIKKAADELAVGTGLIGIDEAAAAIKERVLKAEADFRKANIALQEEENRLSVSRVGILREIERNENRIAEFGAEGARVLAVSESLLTSIANKTRERAEIEQRLASAQIQARLAQQKGYFEAAALARERATSEQESLDTIDAQLEAARKLADVLFEQADLTDQQRAVVQQALLARFNLSSQLQTIEDQTLAIANDRAAVERQINEALVLRLSLEARSRAAALAQDNIKKNIDLDRDIAIAQAEEILNQAIRRKRIADAEVRAISGEIADAERRRIASTAALIADIAQVEEQLRKLEAARAAATAGSVEATSLDDKILKTKAAITDLQSLQAERERSITLEILAKNQALAEAQKQQEEARLALEQPIQFGFVEGIKQFIEESGDLFTQFRDQIASTFQQLSQTLAKGLTDALTGQGGNFREEFANFLASIAQAFIQMFIQVAIARAFALGFSGGGSVPSLPTGALGLAKGGPVPRQPRTRRVTSPFSKARGFAKGGLPSFTESTSIPPTVSTTPSLFKQIRPKGLDPKDTVPIWVAPGEYVIQKKAVKAYGEDIMGMLNSVLIDPAALSAIAGVNSRGRAISRVSKGAASGGSISSTSGAPAASINSRGGSGRTLAVVAGTEDNMQQLLHGGRSAMIDFLRANKDAFMGEERARTS